MSKQTGNDGSLAKGTLGVEIIGTASPGDLDDDTLYLVTAVDPSASGFASNSGADNASDIEAGYIIKGNSTWTLTVNDKVKPISLELLCSIKDFSLAFSLAELDATTLCDTTKVYLPGKSDMSGSLNGLVINGITDAGNGLFNTFIDVIEQDITGDTLDLFKMGDQDTILLGQFATNKGVNGKETFFFAPITIYSSSINMAIDALVEFGSSFRFAPYENSSVFPGLYQFTV